MGLEIRTTWAKVAIETIPTKVNITTQPGKMNIDTEPGSLSIQTDLPKVHIDQSACFAEVGLKKYYELTQEWADSGKQSVLDYIAKKSSDGKAMANISDGRSAGQVAAQIAKQATVKTVQINIDVAPKSMPEVEVTGSIDINWTPAKVNVNYTPAVLNYQVSPGRVNVSLNPPGSISIRWLDQHV